MKKSYEVLNIRCGGCASTIKKALLVEGFKNVEVDLSCEPRKVAVELPDEALEAHFIMTLRKLGYPLVDDNIGKIDSAGLKAKSLISCAVGKFSLSNDKF